MFKKLHLIYYFVLFILVIYLFYLFIIPNAKLNVVKVRSNYNLTLLESLIEKVNEYQVLNETKYVRPLEWAKKLGMYENSLRLNAVGGFAEKELRSSAATAIFDNNIFSTSWIVTILLESIIYGVNSTPRLSPNRLQLSINALNDFHDKNIKIEKSAPIMKFYTQVYNTIDNLWQTQTTNLAEVTLNFEKIQWNELENKLDEFYIKLMKKMFENLSKLIDCTSGIPSDFDDTYTNLGIGVLLYRLNNIYKDAFDAWNSTNYNTKVLVEQTIKYAYKPFDANVNNNFIDPSTYFYLRPFLLEAQKNNQSVALIPTWNQNMDEQRVLASKRISLPLNLNNVDVAVDANSIHGIASAALYNLNGFQNHFAQSNDLQQIFLNTTKFVSWAIKTNFTSRPDLAQVYYPSRFKFLWCASRTLFLIENEIKRGELHLSEPLRAVFIEAKGYLKDAFQNTVTKLLLNTAQRDPNVPNEVYFDDFLGVNDTDSFGKQKPTGEDRIFSTAQAINILISTWTVQDPKTKKLIWKDGVTQSIKDLMQNAATWLQENVFKSFKYKPLNAVFGGAYKGFSTFPFWYPANFIQYLNGTNIDPLNVKSADFRSIFYGVSGTIDEDVYQRMLNETHFGHKTETDFQGYNQQGNIYMIWSSEPYTYACSLLALSQYWNIE